MEKQMNALKINQKDNVVTVLKTIRAGEEVRYLDNGLLCSLTAGTDAMIYNKLATDRIPEGDLVYKYGEVIGKATELIRKGNSVSHLNIASLPRDYEAELH